MPVSSKAIANFFLRRAKAAGESVTPMKLQKLVYYANGWYMGYTNEPLIDEPIEAWQFGPVIPSLYHAFKQFGARAITVEAQDFNPATQSFEVVAPPSDPALLQFLENIWRSYGQYTGIRLSEMTHAPGGPWEETWREAAGMRGVDIPQGRIADHFREAVRNTAQQD
ncbi:MAG: SocA family protein [Pseudacidovorax sp.]|uniref:Panacea domain-containing protein n=1 Tax=Pseudacidovorax sp. TaxID=1934311 RepID=UPI001B660C9D|nr:type II toxin-antitoxin system antitoxin SocA domain-containing protein [Pseudacidovorax sp.]MBP6897309.1 SocA family protein [Pseudacidovorax sp.]